MARILQLHWLDYFVPDMRAMRLQLLSDLHLETETFSPQPAPGADVLVLAGDIDAQHTGLDRFAEWPVPVLFVAGNHEFDNKDFDATLLALRERCERNGIIMLERESIVMRFGSQRVRFVGTTLWNDFDLFGPDERQRCMRAARYFIDEIQRSTRHGMPMDAEALRQEGLLNKAWLSGVLQAPPSVPGEYDKTVIITHFAPSLRSTDARYPVNGATASFCNAYDDLIERCHLWIHGHLHCRHDYAVGTSRVICNSRGHASSGEDYDFKPLGVWEV